jgi:hypothetical protein
MNIQVQANYRNAERQLPFECVALVLQGGGALGAYQAGVYEALAEAKIEVQEIPGKPGSYQAIAWLCWLPQLMLVWWLTKPAAPGPYSTREAECAQATT